MLDGVDTSHHQSGKIDLRKAQHAGVRWWYVKATDGETTVDDTYGKRVREARRAGVPVGAYHFARPDGGDASKEAQHFLETAKIQLGDMIPMLDLEARAVLSREQLTRWVGVWVTTVRTSLAKRGLVATPIIYTPFDLDDAFGCKLWVARYSDDFRAPRIPEPWTRAAIWQHSDGKVGPIRNVPGFGPVDVNAMHPDLPLSALRVQHARERDELNRIRRDLQAAMKRLDDALDRLPERSSR
jgi:GH25 family lysozyme M1 (1,4-beta-N-acetylmuramidase)